MRKDHERHVIDQFGTQAYAYVTSDVHSLGADLSEIDTIAANMGGGRALDLGAGGGHVSYRLGRHMDQVVAYDLSAEMLAAVATEAQKRSLGNIVTQQGSVESLPFPDASFDLTVTRFSAHHWRDLNRALREARRVLKPSGRAVFIDVASPGTCLLDTHLQAVELLRDPSHVRDYSVAEWQAALTGAGFRTLRLQTDRLLLEFDSWTRRMRTPDIHQQSIRSLQRDAAQPVRDYFEINESGNFTVDTVRVEAA